ncbi:hypothetical protein [Streptomyces glaucescens]|uniref:hypothetical protein n=1 Tax=Streptomyces glaucescens TaxID=1907 RepID=UPI000A3CB735|nr:hypothetical protein [Streptomyces glaucescens]
MRTTGALPPYRSVLARLAETTSRAGAAVRQHRSWSRERRAALHLFYDELGLKPGASVQDVLRAMADLRGRTVETFLLSGLPPRVSGVTVQGEDTDYIGISDRLSPWHQALVSLHEARHLRVPHSGAEDGPGDACSIAVHSQFDGVTLESLREQMSALPDRVREEIITRPAKLRAGYGDDEELTCEIFARVVLPLLDLDPTSQSTGRLTSAISNRRSI